MLKNLPDDVRMRTLDAVSQGTGKVELRARADSNETELVLVPGKWVGALWITKTS